MTKNYRMVIYNPMDREKLRAKTIGSVMAAAIGDAAGLPVECKSPGVIRQLFGYVDKFLPNTQHGYPEVAKRAAGTVSDDTQLPRAIIESLIRTKGYDIDDIRKAHVEAFEGAWGTPVGWGGSTKSACLRMKNGETETFAPDGAGNGPTIKIYPLGIFCCYKAIETKQKRFTNSFNLTLLKKCREISLLTHGDRRCIVAAYCQARMVIRAMQDEIPQHAREIAALFLKDARYAESHVDCTIYPDGLLSDRMAQFLTTEQFERETSAVSVDICCSQSSYIMNSYPLTAYSVSKYLPYQNVMHAILMTVNAGADADSNASMVGAIIGASLGLQAIPTNWISNLRDARSIMAHARNFHLGI